MSARDFGHTLALGLLLLGTLLGVYTALDTLALVCLAVGGGLALVTHDADTHGPGGGR